MMKSMLGFHFKRVHKNNFYCMESLSPRGENVKRCLFKKGRVIENNFEESS